MQELEQTAGTAPIDEKHKWRAPFLLHAHFTLWGLQQRATHVPYMFRTRPELSALHTRHFPDRPEKVSTFVMR